LISAAIGSAISERNHRSAAEGRSKRNHLLSCAVLATDLNKLDEFIREKAHDPLRVSALQ
jgi:hypothetical protein